MADYVYFIQRKSDNLIKIGYSADFEYRRKQLSVKYKCQTIIVGYFFGGYNSEHDVHDMFWESRVKNELFKPTSDLVEFIMSCAQEGGILRGRMPGTYTIERAAKLLNGPQSLIADQVYNSHLKASCIDGVYQIRKLDIHKCLRKNYLELLLYNKYELIRFKQEFSSANQQYLEIELDEKD